MPGISCPIQIRFADVDMAHHVHNAVYLQWFELARMELLRAFIPSRHDWRKEGLILARNEIDYRMPVHLNDAIETDCRPGRIGAKSFDLHYAVFRVADGERSLCAEGRSVMVCFDYEARHAIAIPGTWRDALTRLTTAE